MEMFGILYYYWKFGIGVIINSRKIFTAATAAEYDLNCREVICEYVGAIKGLVVLCCVIMMYWLFLPLVRCSGLLLTKGLLSRGPVVSLFAERSSLDKSGISLFLFVSFGFFL